MCDPEHMESERGKHKDLESAHDPQQREKGKIRTS